ncbi:MAG: hypothetical protein Q3976_06235 [Corynebacterium sp.]|nr:hypothetical protein [Corynebacterium sp.]
MSEEETNEPENWSPSLGELIEAVEDESHPHHAEAVKRNQELAAKMRPTLERLQASTKGISDLVTSPAIRAAQEQSARVTAAMRPSLETIRSQTSAIEEVINSPAVKAVLAQSAVWKEQPAAIQKILKPALEVSETLSAARIPTYPSADITTSPVHTPEGLDEVWEQRRIDKEEKIAREEQTIELLTALVAQATETKRYLGETNKNVDAINEAIIQSDGNANAAHKQAMYQGWWTLFAAVAGVVVSILLFILTYFVMR